MSVILDAAGIPKTAAENTKHLLLLLLLLLLLVHDLFCFYLFVPLFYVWLLDNVDSISDYMASCGWIVNK